MKRLLAIGLALLAGLWIGPAGALAQGDDDTCPAIVEAALAATDESCAATGRDQACYGHTLVEAESQPRAARFVFEAVGDIIDVAGVQSLRTSAMDLAAETWGMALLRIQANLPDTLPGQAVTLLLFGDAELVNAAVVSPTEGTSGPMQAFYLTTGLGDAPCAEAPESGLLIQTPTEAVEVTLSVNGVEIGLGSTVFLQAQPGDALYTTVLEGRAAVSVAGMQPVIPAGMVGRIPLDEQGAVSGPPGQPEPYDAGPLQALPLQLLEREITIATVLLDVSYCNNLLGGEIEAVAGQPITAATYPGGWNNAEDTAAVMPYTGVSMTVAGVPAAFIGLGPVGRCVENGVETCYNFPAYFGLGPLDPGDHVIETVHDHPGLRPWYPDGATEPRVWAERCVVHARPPELPGVE